MLVYAVDLAFEKATVLRDELTKYRADARRNEQGESGAGASDNQVAGTSDNLGDEG